MIRAGFASDKHNAISCYKVTDAGTMACGFMLAGFGTKPPAGVICDDGIQKCVDFAAVQLQRAFQNLSDKQCEDFEVVKTFLGKQLDRISACTAIFSRGIGQGIYLAGTVLYVIGEHYICLPFGGAYACIADTKNILSVLRNKATIEGDHYVRDALGGRQTFPYIFEEGRLRDGQHLLCMTQAPSDDLLNSIIPTLDKADLKMASYAIYTGMDSQIVPVAVQIVSQAGVPVISGGAFDV